MGGGVESRGGLRGKRATRKGRGRSKLRTAGYGWISSPPLDLTPGQGLLPSSLHSQSLTANWARPDASTCRFLSAQSACCTCTCMGQFPTAHLLVTIVGGGGHGHEAPDLFRVGRHCTLRAYAWCMCKITLNEQLGRQLRALLTPQDECLPFTTGYHLVITLCSPTPIREHASYSFSPLPCSTTYSLTCKDYFSKLLSSHPAICDCPATTPHTPGAVRPRHSGALPPEPPAPAPPSLGCPGHQ